MAEKQPVIQFKRLDWIDMIKGIGIILVIIGHCVHLEGGIHRWIFSFHMPMFFVFSGFFVKNDNLVNIIRKKTISLLIPYVIFILIGFLFTLSIPVWRKQLTLKGIISDIYLGSPDNINISSVWFLICLFITILLLVYCLKFEKYAPFIIISIVCAGFCFAKYRNMIEFLPAKRLPLNIDVAMIALLFLAIGYYGKNKIITVVEYVKVSTSKNIIICAVFLLVSILLARLNGRVNLHGLLFNNIILYILEACVGTCFAISLALILEKLNTIKRILLFGGRNSLKVLGIQALLIRIYISFINLLTNKEYKLYFLPPMHVLLSTLFVVGFSFLSIYIINIINNRYIFIKNSKR